jgi:hypothetical protein
MVVDFEATGALLTKALERFRLDLDVPLTVYRPHWKDDPPEPPRPRSRRRRRPIEWHDEKV